MNPQIIIPNIPEDDYTLETGVYGRYISKRVWVDAYRKLTIYFNEDGSASKEEYKAID